jgi:2'-5' RNA ligase
VSGDDRTAHLRLFCALLLPGEAVEQLAAWQEAHLRGGRLVPRENLHVTLAFLGARPAAEAPAIAGALRDAAAGMGPLLLEQGRYVETRSVGMVVLRDVTGAATALADDLGARLAGLGAYRREQRPWLPHVTVLRFRSRPRLSPPDPGGTNICPSDAAVMVSVLRPDGARYDVLEKVDLGGR